jgi:hypothetical protein
MLLYMSYSITKLLDILSTNLNSKFKFMAWIEKKYLLLCKLEWASQWNTPIKHEDCVKENIFSRRQIDQIY